MSSFSRTRPWSRPEFRAIIVPYELFCSGRKTGWALGLGEKVCVGWVAARLSWFPNGVKRGV